MTAFHLQAIIAVKRLTTYPMHTATLHNEISVIIPHEQPWRTRSSVFVFFVVSSGLPLQENRRITSKPGMPCCVCLTSKNKSGHVRVSILILFTKSYIYKSIVVVYIRQRRESKGEQPMTGTFPRPICQRIPARNICQVCDPSSLFLDHPLIPSQSASDPKLSSTKSDPSLRGISLVLEKTGGHNVTSPLPPSVARGKTVQKMQRRNQQTWPSTPDSSTRLLHGGRAKTLVSCVSTQAAVPGVQLSVLMTRPADFATRRHGSHRHCCCPQRNRHRCRRRRPHSLPSPLRRS
jgi:hypothetical protein